DTVTGELAQFYQLPKTDSSIESMRSTLGSLVNRNAAITRQAQSMSEKLDSYEQTWKNAAPSKAYEAPMPFIDSAAKHARDFLLNTSSEQPKTPTVPAEHGGPAAPQGAVGTQKFDDGKGNVADYYV